MAIWHAPVSLDDVNASTADGAASYVGIEFIEAGDNYLVARMPVDHRTRQKHGILNGGASCLLAESLGSHASSLCVDPDKHYCVGLDINANLMFAYLIGERTSLHAGFDMHYIPSWETIQALESTGTNVFFISNLNVGLNLGVFYFF